MNKKRFVSILTAVTVLALVTLACGISIPAGIPSASNVATQVAGTMSALAGTVEGALTPEAHVLPTLAPVEVTVAPLAVSFVGPDRNLYFWNETLSTPTQLTVSGDVDNSVISSDGTIIAFTRSFDYTNFTLDVIRPDGSGALTLVTAEQIAALPRPEYSLSSAPSQLEWISNTHTLAMNVRIQFEGPGLIFGEFLYNVDAETGMMTPILNAGTAWKFTYSPDGTKVAISKPHGIDLYNADGTIATPSILVHDFVNTASEYAWVASPIWSADSSRMAAYVPQADPWTDPVANANVWMMYTGGTPEALQMSAPIIYFPSGTVAISPDLSKILYFTRYGAPVDNTYTINLSNLDGTDLTSVVSGGYYHVPVWSTDSNKYIYSDLGGAVYLGQVGVGPTLITDFSGLRDVKWIDADRYIALVGPIGGWKLLLGTVGSSTGVIYTTSLTGDEFMSFSVNR